MTSGSTAVSYFLPDALGSTRTLTNLSGNITATYSYEAFGEVLSQTGTGDSNYLYAGQQFDELTNLYSLRARYYDPSAGRFLSRDTWAYNFQSPVELNRYVYAMGNPVRYSDPSGNTSYSYAKLTRNSAALGLLLLRFGEAVAAWLTAVQWLMNILTPRYPHVPAPAAPPQTQPGQLDPMLEKALEDALTKAPIHPLNNDPDYEEYRDPNLEHQPDLSPIPIKPRLGEDEDDFIFYYSEIPYSVPGRDTADIIANLQKYPDIEGMKGEIAQIKQAEEWGINPVLMGRKYEAERAIYYASKNALMRARAAGSGCDLIPQNFGTVQCVQVKWSVKALPKTTIRDVISEARDYPSGTYLLEANNLDANAIAELQKAGGQPLPFSYP